jgi:hypothetical protein
MSDDIHEPGMDPVNKAMIDGCVDFVNRSLAPLRAKVAELEARPVIKFCGPWRSGAAYPKDGLIVYGGSLWIALRDTTARPNASDDFQLVVKKGSFTE